MSVEVANHLEQRVLLLAPTERDAKITGILLSEAGLNVLPCKSISELCAEYHKGCGVILLTEEAIASLGIGELIRELVVQPAWSELPLIMLMRGGTQSPESARVLQLLRNVTLLERPAPTRSVISAVQAAVRGRLRQYQAREHIAEIQRAQSKYKELQQQLEIAVEASELGTFHCEFPSNRIIWNDRCKIHFWLPPQAAVDLDLFYSIIHPEDRDRTRQAVDECVYHGGIYDIEYRTVSPTGQIRWVRATGRTFFDPQGNPIEFDGTTQDITGRRNAAEEREKLLFSEQNARAESERAGRIKDEFLATLSHELRTPLNAILGWSQLLRLGDDKKTLKEGLEVIERNAKVQVQLIEDLLDMSRIISGKVRLDIKSIDPAAFIIAALETVAPSANVKGIHLHKSLAAKSALIAGDSSRLQQVVWNLLANAIKFTPRGGTVRVDLERADSQIQITVVDTGQGIKSEFLPHVFERFRQADASSTRSYGGLGLGLAIVKQLIELHGGTITATSPGPDQGSTFVVMLPILDMNSEQADESTHRSKPAPPCAFGGEHEVLNGMTVLVVDDDPDARGLLKRVLEECGAKVTTAASAAEAIKVMPSLKPDVLVSDIGMPGTDGYELLKQVRALGNFNGGDVPAIALTAFARTEDRTRALRAGYLVHISKPVEPYELVATVATAAGRIHQPVSSAK